MGLARACLCKSRSKVKQILICCQRGEALGLAALSYCSAQFCFLVFCKAPCQVNQASSRSFAGREGDVLFLPSVLLRDLHTY